MRISNTAAFARNVASLQERQSELSELQDHLNAQKRVLRASDDPVAAARAERAQAQIARSEAQQRAVDASRSSMTQTESTLGDAIELMQDARQALVQAGNGALSDSERANVGNQLQSLRSQLLALANRDDGAGNYFFGGQGSSAPPFAEGPTGVVFHGTAGSQVGADGGEGLALTVDGQGAWLQAADGNGLFKATNTNSTTAWSDGGHVTDPATFFAATSPPAVTSSSALRYQVQFSGTPGAMSYTVVKDGAAMGAAQPWTSPNASGSRSVAFDGMSFAISGAPADGDVFEVRLSQPTQSVFDTLDRAIAQLKTPNRSGAQVAQTVQEATAGLDTSLSALSSLRSRVGESLNHADAAEERNTTLKLQGQEAKSQAEDLDPLQALSEFQLKNTGYDAALKTYSMVQKLSIFNYIG
jgi:flagellar hook-associated protein 3 FlgL